MISFKQWLEQAVAAAAPVTTAASVATVPMRLLGGAGGTYFGVPGREKKKHKKK